MSGPFRDEVECLRAENVRLTTRVAELEARVKREAEPVPEPKVAMRWAIVPSVSDTNGASGPTLAVGLVIAVAYAGCAAIAFIGWAAVPMSSGMEQRGALVFAVLALVWCLAFVRRVPR